MTAWLSLPPLLRSVACSSGHSFYGDGAAALGTPSFSPPSLSFAHAVLGGGEPASFSRSCIC